MVVVPIALVVMVVIVMIIVVRSLSSWSVIGSYEQY